MLYNKTVADLGFFSEGSFKNYVDKMRWVGGQKCFFLSTFRVKNVHVEVGR